jgi:hypothetical protein
MEAYIKKRRERGSTSLKRWKKKTNNAHPAV